jgi:YVTN family beta-propeller protein
MQSRNLNVSRSLTASFAALWVILAMGWPGEALAWTGQPLAYVKTSGGISVIDTGDNKVVDTIASSLSSLAVAPDGRHIYFLNGSSVSVIDATNDTVVATVPLDVSNVEFGVDLNENSSAIAVTPDGRHIYVTTGLCSSISFDCVRPESVYFAIWVIDTATNKVVASLGKGIADAIAFTPDGQHTCLANFDPYTVLPQVLVFDKGNIEFNTGRVISLPGNGTVYAIAITPDGRYAYLPYDLFNNGSGFMNVAIIDIATNTVAANTIPVGTPSIDTSPTFTGVVVTPDGKYVYVSNQVGNSVAVIDTTSNTIVKTVSVGQSPAGLAVTPDGANIYVANEGSDSISVISRASNTVVATVLVVGGPSAISIIPPPQGVPFLSFEARLGIHLGRQPKRAAFELGSTFVLSGTASDGIHPDTEAVKLQVGPFIATIPVGSFRRRENRSYTFEGVIDGVRLEVKIEPRGGFRYAFHAEAKGANLKGTTNPVQVSLGIGDDAGLSTVKAHFDRDHPTFDDLADHWR